MGLGLAILSEVEGSREADSTVATRDSSTSLGMTGFVWTGTWLRCNGRFPLGKSAKLPACGFPGPGKMPGLRDRQDACVTLRDRAL